MWVGQDSYEVMPSVFQEMNGTLFSNAVATTPLCCPSRASIFSGLYAHNHGVTDQSNGANLDQTHTLQYELQQAGYRTAIAGKFLNDWMDQPPYFDRWAVLLGDDGPYPYYGATFNINGVERVVDRYTTDFIARKGVAYLDKFELEDEAPWFMQLSPYAPHFPATPEPAYEDADVPRWIMTPATLEEDLSDKPPWLPVADKPTIRRLRRYRLRSLMSVNDLVEKVRERLRDLGEARDTIIIFMSDNGFLHYDHKSSGKAVPYEQSVRIPLFVKWTGVFDRGVDERIVANIDIAPTIYEAAGVTPAYIVDGRSLLTSDRARAFIEHLKAPHPWESFWHPEWTYARYEDFREFYGPDDPWQLLNLYGDDDITNDPDHVVWDAELDAAAICGGPSCP